MNEKMRKAMVYSSLACATLYGAYNLSGPDPATVSQPDQLRTVAALPAQATEKTVEQFIDVEEKGKAAWGKDPFRAKKVRKARSVRVRRNEPEWFLSGILYNSNQPLAVINKRTVKAGDIVDHARVIQIDRKKVLLEYKGSRFELTVTKG